MEFPDREKLNINPLDEQAFTGLTRDIQPETYLARVTNDFTIARKTLYTAFFDVQANRPTSLNDFKPLMTSMMGKTVEAFGSLVFYDESEEVDQFKNRISASWLDDEDERCKLFSMIVPEEEAQFKAFAPDALARRLDQITTQASGDMDYTRKQLTDLYRRSLAIDINPLFDYLKRQTLERRLERKIRKAQIVQAGILALGLAANVVISKKIIGGK